MYETVNINNQQLQKFDPMEPIEQEFTFKLKETDGWRPVLSTKDFQRLLSNLSSIRIKSNLGGYTFLKSFALKTAQRVQKLNDQSPAKWIEECTCPPSHTGQFCEQCQHGYRREIPYSDSFARCVPCSCNNHSLTCDQSSGKCNCIHQTTGENCETCKEGYYGDALQGTQNDCKKCPCPNDGPCAEFFNHQSRTTEVVCLNCPIGTRGNLCDMCDDGYSESSRTPSSLVCDKCTCNSNIDFNAIGNCDSITGNCLRCVYNTTGSQCEKCLSSYWGSALSDLKCHACECFELGSENSECDLENGQCSCKKNIIGRQCDKCKDTYWNIESDEGCEECKCNPLGSTSLTCDQHTGKCECRPGVTGEKCDECLVNHYGFSGEGCQNCECDPFGSVDLQCNEFGKCKCKENIAGDKCNQCVENFYNFTMGCQRCDDCYNLVQDAVSGLRKNINKLETSLTKIIPETVSEETLQKNKELQEKLENIKENINDLHSSLYKKELLKLSYKDSIKSIEDSIQAINSDFKKVQKPFDAFELKLKELIPLETKVNKSYADIGLQLTMVSIVQQQHQSHIDSIRSDFENEINDENSVDAGENDQADNNVKKLKQIATKSRDLASEQEKLVKNFSELAKSYLESSSNAITDINDLMLKFDRVQTEPDIDYDNLSKASSTLAKEADEIKLDLDNTIQIVKESKAKLDKFTLSEDDYNKEIKASTDKLQEFNTLVLDSKSKLDQLENKLKTLVDSSQSDLLKAQNTLNSAKIKNAVCFS